MIPFVDGHRHIRRKEAEAPAPSCRRAILRDMAMRVHRIRN